MVTVWALPHGATSAGGGEPVADDLAAAPGVPAATPDLPPSTVAITEERQVTDAAPGASLLPSVPGADALAAFEDFVAAVASGDDDAVAARLVAVLPDLHGVGTSGWPLLPTDAGLWPGGVLDRDRVEGFVSYLAGVSASVRISDCESWGGGPRALLATCDYETSGGVLERLGLPPETGHLHGVMVGAQVAGTFRHGSVDLAAWARLAEWAAVTHPEAMSVLAVAATGTPQPNLDAVYSADAAVLHLTLATEMAAAHRGSQREAAAAQLERVRSTRGIVR